MPVIPPQKYKDIESSLKTGDLFLFYGQSDAGILIEDLESIAGMPPYSHLGMVINDQGNLYFWDAPGGGNTFPDPYGRWPPNSYSPADFVRTDKALNLIGGLTLETGIPVEWDSAAQPAAVS